MKTKFVATQMVLLSAVLIGRGQGTLQYDQQSVPNDTFSGDFLVIQTNGPIGQSFVPSLSSVGFVRMLLADGNPGNHLGGTVYFNLRADSITGPILGSTDPVFMPDGYNSVGNQSPTNFFFSTPVAVTPGTTYYLEPVVQSGDRWDEIYYQYFYPHGSAYIQGNPTIWDLWFREGVVVPEPSSALLISVGAGAIIYVRRKYIGNPRI
jgi:hypothetical protein